MSNDRLMTDEHIRDLIRRERELWESRAAAQDRAVVLAREEVDRRLEAMNELRAQINSERGMFTTRELHDRDHWAMETKVGEVEKRLSASEGSTKASVLWMGAVITLVVSITTIAIELWLRR